MTNLKLSAGIATTLLGSCIMIASMISGISAVAGDLYEDIHTFHIETETEQAGQNTSSFSIHAGQTISVWLMRPDRQIENKDIRLDVSLITIDGRTIDKFSEDFQYGYLRNSSERNQYYKLGEHIFQNGFKGYLQYKVEGTWPSPEYGALVLRRSLSMHLPLKQIGYFAAGMLTLIFGIGTIAKRSKRKDNNQLSEDKPLNSDIKQ